MASSLGTLYWLPPVLHPRVDDLPRLDAADASTLAWRDAVRDGIWLYAGWPAFINTPRRSPGSQLSAPSPHSLRLRERQLLA